MITSKPFLAKSEIYFCGFIWISAFLYASYNVYHAGKYFVMSEIGDDFETGWFFHRRKDCADFEWRNWIALFKGLLPWFFIHLLVSEFTRWALIEALPLCYFMITNLVVLNFLGRATSSMLFITVVLHFVALRARSEMLIWLLSVLYFFFFAFGIVPYLAKYGVMDHSITYYSVVVSAWMLLKCSSFCLDHVRTASSKISIETFLLLFGYSYYFPLFFFGPFMLYEEYEKGVKKPFQRWTLTRLSYLFFNLLRFGGWIIILDIFLHFFYIHALEYNLTVVKSLGAWYFNGVAYLLALFFTTKYVAFYGFTGSLARAENFAAPPPPACMCYMYCDSQLWRTFDVGYYQFMKRYIYLPILGDGTNNLLKRLFASGVTFCYVFLWHGITAKIFLWSLLNYIELSLESVMLYISRIERFQHWVTETFSEQNRIRLSALFYAPFNVFGIYFNSYFFAIGGGSLINKQFLEGNWLLNGSFLLISYCFCITAISISERRKINEKSKYDAKLERRKMDEKSKYDTKLARRKNDEKLK